MMTLNGLMDYFEVPAAARYVAGGMLAMKGMSLDDPIGINFDRAGQRVRVSFAGQTVADATFDQIEAVVNLDGPSPTVDCGYPVGSVDLGGAGNPIPA